MRLVSFELQISGEKSEQTADATLEVKSDAAYCDKQAPLMQDHECNCSLVWHDSSRQKEMENQNNRREKGTAKHRFHNAVSD